MRNALYGAAGVIALVVAFIAGTFFPHKSHDAEPVQKVAAVPIHAPVADDPAKKLQMDVLCGQSATAYAAEHELKGLGSQNEFEHGYNSHLGKCFVLMRSFFSAEAMGANYSTEHDWLNDTATGEDYGDYGVKNGPPTANSMPRTVDLCSILADGVTLQHCTNPDQWKAYADMMLHG